MIIEDLYSRRYKKEYGLFPDVFTYEPMPEKLKITLSKVFSKALNECQNINYKYTIEKCYKSVHDSVCEEHSFHFLGMDYGSYEDRVLTFFIKNNDTLINLDITNLVLNILYHMPSSKFIPFIQEINQRMLEHGFGYQYEDGLLVRIDSKHTHIEIIKPALLLLQDDKFKNADDEFRNAFEAYKNGKYEETIREANNAFESTMKIICHLKGYELPKKHNATALIAHLRNKQFIPDFEMEIFNGLAKCLESVSTMRNNIAGHGRGHEERTIEPNMVSYVLNMTAANIKFLVELSNLK